MKIEKKSNEHVTIQFSIDELVIINNALNEVCNGLFLRDDFETRMGATIKEARDLLAGISLVL